MDENTRLKSYLDARIWSLKNMTGEKLINEVDKIINFLKTFAENATKYDIDKIITTLEGLKKEDITESEKNLLIENIDNIYWCIYYYNFFVII